MPLGKLRDSKTRIGASRYDCKLQHQGEKHEKQENHNMVNNDFKHFCRALHTLHSEMQVLYTPTTEATRSYIYPTASICGIYKKCVHASPCDFVSG
jgi:hypothetical protein